MTSLLRKIRKDRLNHLVGIRTDNHEGKPVKKWIH